ncbi:collagen alpha-1(XXIV) chain [Pelobates cultripes]|uniref:Collagen alpha-1(XXIV) chain n=1 Tax=Pelobates cultripes TaxID=61616 RepID=A0AAD1WJ32_PELCU|nr:collagen alpha-1(XXIV) chain [Pelobates cultripes]
MGRNRRSDYPQTPRGVQPKPQQGPMDGFVHSQRGPDREAETTGSAPPSLASTADTEPSALDRIGEELRIIATSMATKSDLLSHTTAIQDALRVEIAGNRTEVGAQAGCIQSLETALETQAARISTADTAISRQGELLLTMRRTIEDLDNRGRRCNIRGEHGLQGHPGKPGQRGFPGSQGDQGHIGEIGLKGLPGEDGDQGLMGFSGFPGPKGPNGDVGAVGIHGPKGPSGQFGKSGPLGPGGIVGPTGKLGNKGEKGSKGTMVKFQHLQFIHNLITVTPN